MSKDVQSGFDRTVQETNIWLQEIGTEMNHPSRKVAYHALRGVLFALRDRLPVDEAFNLSAQLPMLIRGIYFEGYKPSGKPQKFGKAELLERVNTELQEAGGANPEAATRAVIRVLDRHITGGEMDDVRSALPSELQGLMPEWIMA